MIKKFDNWDIYEGSSEGSGRSEKIWLVKDGMIGLFKYPKVLKNEREIVYTKEYVSEKLASLIANKIGVDCAEIDIGIRENKIGCMSYDKKGENEILIEGINFITAKYTTYNVDKLFDESTGEYYSIHMIEESLKGFSWINNLMRDFYRMLVFDFLIGNTDRHQSNWGIILNTGNIDKARFSYLYDNGSSLCSYIDEDNIDRYIGKDKVAFNSLIDTKSKSRIRVDYNCKKEPTHIEVMRYLKNLENYDIINYVKCVIEEIDEEWINNTIDGFEDEMISKKRKVLLKKYLKEKIRILKYIFKGEEL